MPAHFDPERQRGNHRTRHERHAYELASRSRVRDHQRRHHGDERSEQISDDQKFVIGARGGGGLGGCLSARYGKL